MTVFGLVRSAVGNDESARSKYLGPTGKRSAGKLACSVWSGGKAVRPYLSLFEALLHCAPRRRTRLSSIHFCLFALFWAYGSHGAEQVVRTATPTRQWIRLTRACCPSCSAVYSIQAHYAVRGRCRLSRCWR